MSVPPAMVSSYTVHLGGTRVITGTNLGAAGLEKMKQVDTGRLFKKLVTFRCKSPFGLKYEACPSRTVFYACFVCLSRPWKLPFGYSAGAARSGLERVGPVTESES